MENDVNFERKATGSNKKRGRLPISKLHLFFITPPILDVDKSIWLRIVTLLVYSLYISFAIGITIDLPRLITQEYHAT